MKSSTRRQNFCTHLCFTGEGFQSISEGSAECGGPGSGLESCTADNDRVLPGRRQSGAAGNRRPFEARCLREQQRWRRQW